MASENYGPSVVGNLQKAQRARMAFPTASQSRVVGGR